MNAVYVKEVTRSALLPNRRGDESGKHKVLSIKAVVAGKELTDEQLAKINDYAIIPLTKEQVYYVKLLMSHNGIDRDNERFNEALQEDFATTLKGQGFFVEGHPGSRNGKGGPGEGLFFDSWVEQMTPEEFKAKTKKDIKLPPGITMVHALMSDAYILALDSNSDTRAKINAGIIRFSSLGFNAPLYSITDDNGNHIYGEYWPNGEALEGSLVWLGAQPGAGIIKSAKAQKQIAQEEEKQKGETHMKEFIAKLSKKLGKTFTEEGAADEVAAVIAEKETEIAGLKLKAADGEAYRKELVADAMKFGSLTGDIEDGEEKQKAEEAFLTGLSIDRLKIFRDKYEKQARTMFPDKFTFKSKDETDKQKASADAEKKAGEGKKKKDYTDPSQNELLK